MASADYFRSASLSCCLFTPISSPTRLSTEGFVPPLGCNSKTARRRPPTPRRGQSSKKGGPPGRAKSLAAATLATSAACNTSSRLRRPFRYRSLTLGVNALASTTAATAKPFCGPGSATDYEKVGPSLTAASSRSFRPC